MKINLSVTDITHEDLVNILSTALETSYWAKCEYRVADYVDTDQDDYYEDILAKILLAGKTVVINDTYAEDETDSHGNLNHYWDGEFELMSYEVSLNDIKAGITKCFASADYSHAVTNLIENDAINFDSRDADSLLQMIVFGDVIYD